jgi:hypothetical protein
MPANQTWPRGAIIKRVEVKRFSPDQMQNAIRTHFKIELAKVQGWIDFYEISKQDPNRHSDSPFADMGLDYDQVKQYREYLHQFISKLEGYWFNGNDGKPSAWKPVDWSTGEVKTE